MSVDVARLVQAYEHLRAAVLGAPVVTASGLAILRRQGMTAWIAMMSTNPASPARPAPRPSPAIAAPSELAVVIANLVATLAGDKAHA